MWNAGWPGCGGACRANIASHDSHSVRKPPSAGATIHRDAAATTAAPSTHPAALRGPIDSFFDEVTVNDPDPRKRTPKASS